MVRRVEFTPEQLEAGDDILVRLAQTCPNIEEGLALLAHTVTVLITQTIEDTANIPLAVNQVVECLRFNSQLPPDKPVIDAEQLGDRHSEFIVAVHRAMREYQLEPGVVMLKIREAGEQYRQWFNQRGVELYFRLDEAVTVVAKGVKR